MSIAERQRHFSLSMRSRYSYLFPEPDNEEYAVNRYGIEVLPGWFSIVESMIDEIANYATRYALRENLRIIQIKSKFCTLRCTTSIKDKGLELLIDHYAKKASDTCELCGKAGTIRANQRWKKILCDTCERKG